MSASPNTHSIDWEESAEPAKKDRPENNCTLHVETPKSDVAQVKSSSWPMANSDARVHFRDDRNKASTKGRPSVTESNAFFTPTGPWSAAKDMEGNLDCWSRLTVLSCGGGGVRALYQLYFLKILMERIAALEHQYSGKRVVASSADSPLFDFHPENDQGEIPKPRLRLVKDTYLPCHYFDYIGGTSVGGIVAVMLGRLRMSIDQAIHEFELIWMNIGAGMSLYDRVIPLRKAKKSNSEGLSNALERLIEERQKQLVKFYDLEASSFDFNKERGNGFASDPDMCRTIVLAMPDQSDDGLQRPFFFRSYEIGQLFNLTPLPKITSELSSKRSMNVDFSITDVCKATIAAPGYFKGVKIGGVKYRDGRLWNTNPARDLYEELEARYGNAKDRVALLMSIGGGTSKLRRKSSRRSGSETSTPSWRSIDSHLRNLLNERFYAFQGPGDLNSLDLNEWKFDSDGKKTFRRIRSLTESYCGRSEVLEKINTCAEILVKMRHERARTTQWERYAFGIKYHCRVTDHCSSSSVTFPSLEEFLIHLVWEHDQPPQDAGNWNKIQKWLERCQATTVK